MERNLPPVDSQAEQNHRTELTLVIRFKGSNIINIAVKKDIKSPAVKPA